MSPPSYEVSLSNKTSLFNWNHKQLAGTIAPVSCPTCAASSPAASTSRTSRWTLNDHDHRQGLAGLLVRLGDIGKVPTNSVMRNGSQPDINDGAFNHPAIILTQSNCGHLVFCAQLTSFSGYQGIQEKYLEAGNPSYYLWRYLPIQHSASEAHDPTIQPDQLVLDRETEKPSYMNLNTGYWVEWRHLCRFTKTEDWQQARLLPHSLDYATWAYARAKEHRDIYGDDSKRRLARSLTPPQLQARSNQPWVRRVSPQWHVPVPVVWTMPLSAPTPWFTPTYATSENWRTAAPPAHSTLRPCAPSFDPAATSWRHQ